MNRHIQTEPRSSRGMHALASGLTLALAACGGGGLGGSDPTYFAVQGTRTSNGLPVTICITDIAYTDPASPAGKSIASNLATYYGIEGSYRSFAGEGKTCREQFPVVDTLLSTDEYNRVVLPAASAGTGGSGSGAAPQPGGAGAGTPPSGNTGGSAGAPSGGAGSGAGAPSGGAAALPPPIACREGHGTGADGLSLSGISKLGAMTTAANQNATVSLDPGRIDYSNPQVGPGSTTGSLRARLWAVPSSYAGGGISGYVVATYDIRFTSGSSQLRNGESSDLVEQVLSARTPPPGAYCMVVTLEQFDSRTCSSADHYCISDWTQFGSSSSFR